MGNNLKEQVGC